MLLRNAITTYVSLKSHRAEDGTLAQGCWGQWEARKADSAGSPDLLRAETVKCGGSRQPCLTSLLQDETARPEAQTQLRAGTLPCLCLSPLAQAGVGRGVLRKEEGRTTQAEVSEGAGEAGRGSISALRPSLDSKTQGTSRQGVDRWIRQVEQKSVPTQSPSWWPRGAWILALSLLGVPVNTLSLSGPQSLHQLNGGLGPVT